MFKLAQALKGHREAGSLNEQINLFGFVDDHTFLTKSGDVGAVLAVEGVDYECLASNEIDACTKRLESALKVLDDKCRIYQYLFKGSNPLIPYRSHDNPVVNAAIENRIAHLQSKADSLYKLTIYFVVLLESPRAKKNLARLLSKANLPAIATSKNASNSDPRESPRAGTEKPADPDPAGVIPHQSTEGKRYVLFEGTVLEALLINRLDGSFAGPVSCLLSTNVYSHDRQHVLIPAGSKLLGEANKVDTFGQVRLAVTFHRLIMPDGFSVDLDQFKGLDQEGATALKDKVNNHYAKIFGASLAIGVLGGVAQVGTGSVLNADGADRIRQGFGVGMATAGEQILDRFLNILPTVTIREGTRIKIYLSNDLLLPDSNTYTQAVTPVKRGAQARVAKLIMADGSEPKAITPTLQ